MKTKSYLFFAAALFTLAACNFTDENEVTTNDQPSEQVPVTLSAQVQDLTRGFAADGLNVTNIESGQNITVRISPTTAGTYADWAFATGAEGALTPSAGIPYYPTDNSAIDIRAYHPAKTSACFTVADQQPTHFTVKADQSTSANYTESDLMWSNGVTGVSKTDAVQVLNFVHQLCKIKITATGVGDVNKIHGIKLLQVKPRVSFAPATGIVGEALVDATTEDEIEVTMLSGGDAATATAVAIIPAQEITGNLIEFKYSKNGVTPYATAYYKVPSGKTFAPGYAYNFELNVSELAVTGSNTVTDWNNGGTTDGGTIYTELPVVVEP